MILNCAFLDCFVASGFYLTVLVLQYPQSAHWNADCRDSLPAAAGVEHGNRFSSCRTTHGLSGKNINYVSNLKSLSNLREKMLKLASFLRLGLSLALAQAPPFYLSARKMDMVSYRFSSPFAHWFGGQLCPRRLRSTFWCTQTDRTVRSMQPADPCSYHPLLKYVAIDC